MSGLGDRTVARAALAGAIVLVVGAAIVVWQLSKPQPLRNVGVAVHTALQPPVPAGSSAPGTPTPTARATPGSSRSAAPGSSSQRAQTPAAPAGRHCTKPAFVTSDHNGGWSTAGYYVHNNMWNNSVPLGPETLYACAFNNWYVVSNQTDDAGAVKTYPNVHKDYSGTRISSVSSLSSSFAATSPHEGIYDVAYDIWTNGVATSSSTEIMIWTENFHQVPAGDKVRTVAFGGRTYNVWKTADSGYIAFVPTAVITAGTLNLLEMFKWTMAQGWLAASSTLDQICYGVEIVSTGGANQTFDFTNFSISGG
ncbi:MAG TPA: hypothetical protein VH442_10815 [Micromonosporaceae bacterium]